MQRVVYSPKAFVYVRTDLPDGSKQIVDLSDYVVSGSVGRRLNQASEATIEIRNPKKKWTQPGHSVFRPMDPITIWLQKDPKIGPIQVFTGFLDSVPYYQLLPGTCTLKASCTLKKLLYTYWDQGLPATQQVLEKYGWSVNGATGEIFNQDAQGAIIDPKNPNLTDSHIGRLLHGVMTDVAGWPKDRLFIEALPEGLADRLLAVQKDIEDNAEISQAQASFKAFLETILGPGSSSGGGSGPADAGNYNGPLNKTFPKHFIEQTGFERLSHDQVKELAQKAGLPGEMFALIAKGESSYYPGVVQHDPGDGNVGYGLWQMTPHAWGEGSAAAAYMQKLGGVGEMLNPWKCALMAKFLYDHAASKTPNTSGFPWYGTAFLKNYDPSQEDSTPIASSYPGSATTKKATKKKAGAKTDTKIYAPIAGGATSISSPYGEQNHGNPPHTHMGIDVPVPSGTDCVAPADGKIGRFAQTSGFGGAGGMIHFVFTEDVGDVQKGTVIGWGHVQQVFKQPGDSVKAGEVIAKSNHPAPHVHFIQRTDDSDMDGNTDPTALFKALQKGSTSPAFGSGTASGGTGGSSGAGGDFAAAFATTFEFTSQAQIAEALLLTGDKSLMNDTPLMPFIQQLSQGSLRSFESMPDGSFFAFFPDPFGAFSHRKPYWAIENIEILDGKIELSDDALTTHMYVVGNTLSPVQAAPNQEIANAISSSGVATVFNMSELGFINSGAASDGSDRTPLFSNHEDTLAFLRRYGARPYLEDAQLIRNHYFETFMAIHMFMQAWAKQFQTTFTFTFMPELYPGGAVLFPDHDIRMYIEEVFHSFSYESGFTTQASLSAPAAWTGKSAVSQGLIRANVL